MIIATGTLFFVSAVLVNSKELDPPPTYWKLFPHSDILPSAKILKYKDTDESWNLRKLVDKKVTKFDPNSTLLARAQIIVGWPSVDNKIEPLSDPSGRTDHVFDSNKKKFVKLNESDLQFLGVDSLLSTIQTIDEILPTCRPNATSKICREQRKHQDDEIRIGV